MSDDLTFEEFKMNLILRGFTNTSDLRYRLAFNYELRDIRIKRNPGSEYIDLITKNYLLTRFPKEAYSEALTKIEELLDG